MNTLQTLLSYDFILRALVVGVLVALCSALLGVNLVLKRYSMIGDGLSHVAFGAMAVALAMNMAPLAVAIPVVIAAAFFLLKLTENSRIQADAAIALISTSALAVGVLVISMGSGGNTDIYNYMFGSILSMKQEDVILSSILSLIVMFVFVVCYHKLFAVTFDETFARGTGVRVSFYNMLLALLTAVTIVVGMRLVGAMLMSSLIIFPVLTSMRMCRSFRGVVICSAAVSVTAFLIGLYFSFFRSVPTGASIVLVNLAALLVAIPVGKAAARRRG